MSGYLRSFRFRICTALLCTALCAVVARIVVSSRVILHEDWARNISDGGSSDLEFIESYFGRSQRASDAWKKLAIANRKWRWMNHGEAIRIWWSVAVEFSDTDACGAALCNIAQTEKHRGNPTQATHAYETLLLLPKPRFTDRGNAFYDYRYEACIALADSYEQENRYHYAERFLAQAIHQECRRPGCGMAVASQRLQQEKRLRLLRSLQGK